MSRSVTVVLHEREGGRAAVCAVFDTLQAAADAFPAELRRQGGYRLAESELYETSGLTPNEVMRLPDPGPVAGSGEVRLLVDPQLYVGNSVAVSVYPVSPDPDPDPAPDGEDEDIRTLVARLLEVVVKIAHDTGAIRTATELAAPRVHNIDVTASRLEDAFVAAKKAEKTRAATL